jgi:class 3 adenylate cyclase
MRDPIGGSRLHAMPSPAPALLMTETGQPLEALASQNERKTATVLFTDIERSMDLVNTIEPDQWWSLISEAVAIMCDQVTRYGGWIANFTGDGIMAVFESSGDSHQDAQQACDAALALQQALESCAQHLLNDHGLRLAVRIGINSGEILTGTIGAGHTRYHTATGYAVSLAKRIEALAVAGRVYVSEHTAALLPRARLYDLGTFTVKGAPSPLHVFELLGRTPPCQYLPAPSKRTPPQRQPRVRHSRTRPHRTAGQEPLQPGRPAKNVGASRRLQPVDGWLE